MAEKIVGKFIIQIGGKPQENVDKALNMVLEKLNNEKENFKVLDSYIAEPELDEESGIYVGFLEVNAKFKSIEKILGFIVDYTPNSIEIEEPTKMNLTNNDLTEVLNNLSNIVLKLHSENRVLKAHLQNLTKKQK